MCFVLTNGKMYCCKDGTGRIRKTSDVQCAYQYTNSQVALHELLTATKKLKNFYIIETKLNKKKNNSCKRKQFDAEMRRTIYAKTKGHCALCGNFIDFEEFTVDHIKPLAKGGSNDLENLQPACKVCNQIKQDILPDEFMRKITEIFLFYLRSQCNFKILIQIIGAITRGIVHKNKKKGMALK